MTEGAKCNKETGYHNRDMERMQIQKERANVSTANDCIRVKTKGEHVKDSLTNLNSRKVK